MAVTSVIGEAGVRIRPITNDFSRELQALLDQASRNSAGVLPLQISLGSVEEATGRVISQIQNGAQLPITAITKSAEDSVSEVKAQAESGAKIPVTAEASEAEKILQTYVDRAGTPLSLALELDTSSAESTLSETQLAAATPISVPVLASTDGFFQSMEQFDQLARSRELTVPVMLDTSSAMQQLEQLQQVAASASLTPSVDLSGGIAGVQALGGAARDSQDSFGGLGGVVGGLSDQIAGLSGRVRPLLSTGSLLVGGGLVGAAFGVGSILSAGQQRLTTIEDSVTALEIQLGGAKQAADVVADVLATVKGTPFNLDQFVQAARTLITFGTSAEEIPRYLTAIGEAAAGSGQGIQAVLSLTDIFSQIQIAGRVTLDEVNRAALFGVDALTILGNEFGVTTAEMRNMISYGTVPAERALNSLIDGITDGSRGVAGNVNKLGGSMEALRQTFTGASGGLEAASARLGEAILKPFRDTSIKVIQRFTDVLDAVKPTVTTFFTALAASAQGPLDSALAALGSIVDTLQDLGTAFAQGGLEGLFSSIAQLTGPLESAFQSIFNNIREIGALIGPILLDLIDGARNAGKIISQVLGTALVQALRLAVNLLSEVVGFFSALDPYINVIEALGAAFGALAALSLLKRFATVNELFERLNGTSKALAESTAEGTIATQRDTAAKIANTEATNALATAEARLTLAQRGELAADVRGSVGVVDRLRGRAPVTETDPVKFSPNPFDTAEENAKGFERAMKETEGAAERTGNKLTRGLRSASESLRGFASSFGAEIAVIAAVVGYQLGTQLAESIVKGARERGSEQARSILQEINPQLRLTTDRTELTDATKSQAELARIQSELDRRRTELEPGLNAYTSTLNEIAVKADSVADKLLPNFLTPPFIQDSIDRSRRVVEAYEQARTANEALTAAERDAQAVVAGSTKNWNLLAEAVASNATELAQLGAVKISDPRQQAANYEQILATLTAAKSAQLELAGAAPDALVAALPSLQAEAQALSQYDLPSLEKALNDAGIVLSDVAEGDVAGLEEALQKAAEASAEAQLAATGLGNEMARVAGIYSEASKAGKEFASGLFVQQNAWLGALSGVDGFSSALSELQYTTDFTASSLSGIVNGAEGAAAAAYTQARAMAELSGAQDAASQGAAAATATTENLRTQFINTATAAGYSATEAQTLATALFGIPGYVATTIQIDVEKQELDSALAQLKELEDKAANSQLGLLGPLQLAIAKGNVAKQQEEVDVAQRFARLGQAAQDQARKDAESLVATSRQKQEADRARQEAQRSQQEAAQRAKQAADEERRRKEQELREFFQMIQNLERATDQFRGSIENVSKSLQQARDQLVGNLQQRVELSQGSSVTRLIRNASERNRLLAEVQGGVTQLQSRGLSGDALRYLGVTGRAEDARAVRRLLRASPEQLAQLSEGIGTLSDTAQRAAYREQGQIIGKEVRTAIEQWAATPGAQQKLSVEQVLQIVSESRGDPVAIARGVTERIGGTVKR